MKRIGQLPRSSIKTDFGALRTPSTKFLAGSATIFTNLIVVIRCGVSTFGQTESKIRNRIVGTWKFVSTEEVMKDGTTRPYPSFGRTPRACHIWQSGYSAGYYAYLWTQMLADDAYQWFAEHGELSRANGDRFRRMVLSRGNTQDLAKMYEEWRGAPPNTKPMLKYRGLDESTAK